ncbi:MAG: chromosomal replication initiator protein DnaA [Muribaculaceae bacterium]|nr:chromosomal replication initiator protein DnaA [Muribaculaceae bacterium]
MAAEIQNIDLLDKWNSCLELIRSIGIISDDQFNAWIKPIIPLGFDGNRLDVHVPSSYFYEFLEQNYKNILFPVIKKVFGLNVSLFYNYEIVKGEESSNMSVKTENPKTTLLGNPRQLLQQDEVEGVEKIESNLNPRYNFENYCAGSSNKLARSIGEAIARDPKCKTFNPLFIYGASGVGKTHLMHAIGIGLQESDPQLRVLYVTARLFESQFVTATRTGKQNDFISFYQGIDCLIIDDVQELIGKEKTQLAFFHIFNHLHLNNKQIILSSDCAPTDMPDMPERLISRFKWGMVAKLERPDYELRLQVLRQKAQFEGLSLPDDIIEYIARNVTDSIRDLEGVMVSFMAHRTFMGEECSIELVDSIISNSLRQRAKKINFEMITQSVSNFYNIEPDELFTKNRKREISDARQMVMYLAKKHINMPLKAIGTRLARTHATVIHGCENIESRLEMEKQLRKDIETIENSFL